LIKYICNGLFICRYKDDLIKEIPEVDRFFGKFDFDEILKELNIQKRKDLLFDRHLTTPSHFAYLKIAEGCNRTCAFCAIPQFTGNYVSVPMESLIDEAEKLAKKGVKELFAHRSRSVVLWLRLIQKKRISRTGQSPFCY
jgi:ribosomal protein S12 methylthiotransferase